MKTNIYNKLKILYVEDDEKIRNIYTKILQKRITNLLVATNGEEGYQNYIDFNPDIVITDIKMPKLNGLEMSGKIKEKNKTIPIIITSAHDDVEFYAQAIKIGINHYLPKPVDAKELYSALELYAKNILFEQEKKDRDVILQNIINADKNMILVLESEDIIFSNKSFLSFFNIESNEEFKKNFNCIYDTFERDDEVLLKGELEVNETFEELIQRTTDVNRIIKINDSSNNDYKIFFINISFLNKNMKNKNTAMYMLTFTDITLLSKEKENIQDIAYHDGLTKIYNRNKYLKLFHLQTH